MSACLNLIFSDVTLWCCVFHVFFGQGFSRLIFGDATTAYGDAY